MNTENGKMDVFRKNDIASNRVLAIACLVTSAIVIVLWILVEIGVFDLDYIPRVGISVIVALSIASFAVSVHFKHEKKWLMHLLIIALIADYAVLYALFTYYVSIVMVIPTVLSIRYFSKNYTIKVVIGSLVAFLLAAIWGANNGQLDLNYVELPIGTVLTIEESTWLEDAVRSVGYDHGLQIFNVLAFLFSVQVIISLIIIVFSFLVAKQGRNMVIEQQEMTQKTASVTAELELATKIQKDMLPSIFPAFPKREEFDLYASMTPAKEVGGDFYDFFLVDDDHLALVMADVSGKGIPAAMFMMSSKNIIANNVMLGKGPAEALKDANAAICAHNEEDMFVTVWLGILEITTGKIVCANAGHEYPVIQRDGKFELLKDKHGFSVGFFDDSEYEEYELTLKPGDRLFVYTDGVAEATAVNGDMFGTDRITEVLNSKDTEASPKQMLSDMWDAVSEFFSGAEQFDDVTMLALEYRGKS